MTIPCTLPLPATLGGELSVSRLSVRFSRGELSVRFAKGQARQKGQGRDRGVAVSALRSSRLPPPTLCVQAVFCGFHRFTSTVFDVWLLRSPRGEHKFRQKFSLCPFPHAFAAFGVRRARLRRPDGQMDIAAAFARVTPRVNKRPRSKHVQDLAAPKPPPPSNENKEAKRKRDAERKA